MMDTTFYELLVPRIQQTTERVLLIASTTLVVIMTIFAFAIAPLLGGIALILDFLFFTFVLPRFHIEYEYALLQGELDIDVIYKKARRKSLITLDLGKAQVIAPAASNRSTRTDITKTLDFSSRDEQHPPYAIIIMHKQILTRILFQADEKMVALLQKSFPNTFYMD